LYVVGLGIAAAGTGWGLGLAYRFRDMPATALMRLTLFIGSFLSEAQTPLFVMEGWLHTVARVNPFTSILRLARQGWVGDVTWANTWGGVLALMVTSALTMWFARRGLDKLGD
jgi:ABC-2 type transport system permease protein